MIRPDERDQPLYCTKFISRMAAYGAKRTGDRPRRNGGSWPKADKDDAQKQFAIAAGLNLSPTTRPSLQGRRWTKSETFVQLRMSALGQKRTLPPDKFVTQTRGPAVKPGRPFYALSLLA